MKVKLYNKANTYIEFEAYKLAVAIIIPSADLPKYKNVKKEKGEKWNNEHYLKWYYSIKFYWLLWQFTISICCG